METDLETSPTHTTPGPFGYRSEDILREVLARGSRVSLGRGDYLFHANGAGDELFVVISGRLVALGTDRSGRRWVSREMGAGATIGEIGLLTDAPRTADVLALRRSELCRLDRAAFEELCRRHPEFLLHVARTLAERLARAEPGSTETSVERVIAVVGLDAKPTTGASPSSPGVDTAAFSAALGAAFSRLGACARIDASSVGRALGIDDVESIGPADPRDGRIRAWLAAREADADFAVLDAGTRPSPWLTRCLEHADHVLLVADARSAPGRRDIEATLYREPDAASAAVSLALVHPEGTSMPSGTLRWLEPRKLRAHHHLHAGASADVERLARRLAGRGIGFVLSGGGALGAAHFGVYQALVARGVPIDAVGGTSAGGGIAAQIAMGWDLERIRRANVHAWVDNSPFRERTLPVISLISRAAADRTAKTMFGDARIEDLWTPYFGVSTDLSRGATRLHDRGPVWLAVRATSSVPGVLPPVIDDGVLVDGGVLDNLPVSTMKQLCGRVIAVDVIPIGGMEVDCSYEDLPGPFSAIWSRLKPAGSRARLPTIGRVVTRTLWVSSQRAREQSRAAADLLFTPQLDGFGLAQFGAFEAIAAAGRAHAEEKLGGIDLEAWLRSPVGP